MKKYIDRPYSLVIQARAFGDAARSVVLGSGIKNWDLSISKNSRMEEQASFNFGQKCTTHSSMPSSEELTLTSTRRLWASWGHRHRTEARETFCSV